MHMTHGHTVHAAQTPCSAVSSADSVAAALHVGSHPSTCCIVASMKSMMLPLSFGVVLRTVSHNSWGEPFNCSAAKVHARLAQRGAQCYSATLMKGNNYLIQDKSGWGRPKEITRLYSCHIHRPSATSLPPLPKTTPPTQNACFIPHLVADLQESQGVSVLAWPWLASRLQSDLGSRNARQTFDISTFIGCVLRCRGQLPGAADMEEH
jgi:hypothetical protein